MIDPAVARMLRNDPKSYVISADIVANVTATNTLEHAFMVLSKVGYSRIPVLDADDHLQGMISLAVITDKLLHVPGAAVDQLSNYTVADVMLPVEHWVDDPTKLETILNYMINEPFIPLVDEHKVFQGIITRREILKRINYLAHNLANYYEVIPRENVVEEDK
ncbi:cyclic-di-AMP-binding protein CbpB [Levilactobacillus tongjiangensis]|uniref:Cyclic-di-AMP-binding protein CbpB n=1 Tax=Levilactobacillus tongjiangensis TaxID=2486023 RepID=A0ABW1SS97_9LACO|nr:cyclic-di-AMP-binding protein CbpB [Levilactobacillus tongjiangensis]